MCGYSSPHRGKVYYTKVLLLVTEEDRRCPEVICSVDPNSSGPTHHHIHLLKGGGAAPLPLLHGVPQLGEQVDGGGDGGHGEGQ